MNRARLRWRQAATTNAETRWVLPVPESPMNTIGSARSIYPPSASSLIRVGETSGAWRKSNSSNVLTRGRCVFDAAIDRPSLAFLELGCQQCFEVPEIGLAFAFGLLGQGCALAGQSRQT